MKTVNLFTGKKGETGQSGLDGVDVNDIRSTLIENPLIDLFRDNKISKTDTPDWTRTATASIVDRYGQLQFVGGDTIENKFSYSEDFSQWGDPNSQWTILSTGLPDPIGGNDATRIRIDANPSSSNFMTLPYVSLDSGLHVFSVWIRVISGSVTDLTVEPVAPGVEVSVPATVVSEWQRVSLRYSVSPKNDTYAFNIKATQNTEVEIFGIQLEFNTQVGPYTKTTGAPVDGPNPETRWRANDVGYLIEGQKENLTTFSEDFNESAWDVGGGTISAYSGASPAGEFFKDLQVNFTSNNVTLSQDTVSITDGETYTVSLWVLVESGSIDSLVAQVGNGITQAVDAELSGEWQRVSVKCVAGSVNTFSITLTTSESGTVAAVFGAQLELGSLSSYVRTFDSTAVRTADIVEIAYPYNFPDTSLPWSCTFSAAQNTGDDGSRYVFHNGLSGGDEFSAYYTTTSLFIVVAGVPYEYSTTSSDIEIIYDGTNLSVYSLSVLIESKAVTSNSNALGVTMYLGQDLNNQNHLNSLLKGLTFWDDALTFDELRYIRGSDFEG